MPLMLPEISSALTVTAVLTLLYLYLYMQYRERHLLLWGSGWVLYTIRLIFVVLIVEGYKSPQFLAGNQIAYLVSSYLLLWGTSVFTEKIRKMQLLWNLLVASGIGWILFSTLAGVPPLLAAFPTCVLIGLINGWTGVIILRFNRSKGMGRNIAGWGFILWGLHMMNYPFLSPSKWVDPRGFLAGSVSGITAALGILLIYYHDTKSELTSNENRFRHLVENARDTIFRFRLFPTRGFDYISSSVSGIEVSTDQIYTDHNLLLKRVHPGDMSALQRVMFTPLDTEEAAILRWIGADGKIVWTDCRNMPVYDENNNVVAIEGIIRNITWIKIAEEELRDSLREKEILLDEKDNLLEEKELLIKEIHHRVKNSLQAISAILNLQGAFAGNSQFSKYITACQNRVMSMSLIHEKLYEEESVGRIYFSDYIQKLVNHLKRSSRDLPETVIVEVTNGQDIYLNVDTAIPCGLILTELITNCFKHAFPAGGDGYVSVQMNQSTDGRYSLMVKDNGVGLSTDIDIEQVDTLGLTLMRTYVEQLSGTLVMDRGAGTAFTISFDEYFECGTESL